MPTAKTTGRATHIEAMAGVAGVGIITIAIIGIGAEARRTASGPRQDRICRSSKAALQFKPDDRGSGGQQRAGRAENQFLLTRSLFFSHAKWSAANHASNGVVWGVKHSDFAWSSPSRMTDG
jgi:hypothetical protein